LYLQIKLKVEERIVEIARQNPTWGVRKIAQELKKANLETNAT
jgi:hypothetical protein